MAGAFLERFRPQARLPRAIIYGILVGALVGILDALQAGLARGIVRGLAVGLIGGLTRFAFSVRHRQTEESPPNDEQTGLPWLRMLVFSLGFSGLVGAAALVAAAVKSGSTGVLVEGIPEIAGIVLAGAVAVYVILVVTFWWQDRKDRN